MNNPKDSTPADNPDKLRPTRCEFCEELINHHFSRFNKIYGKSYKTRILAERDGLVVLPTIGQLFKCSLLIMPVIHYETMAQLPVSNLKGLISLLADLENKIRPFGTPILFEHGAKCKTGAGCGIYHAHLHLVPVPGEIRWTDVLPDREWCTTNLLEAYARLRGSDNYLIFRDITGTYVGMEPIVQSSYHFQSQYFRRVIADHFALEMPWDWREYDFKEPWLIEAIDLFGVECVSVR